MSKREGDNALNVTSEIGQKQEPELEKEKNEQERSDDKGKTIQQEARKDLEKMTDHVEETEVDSSKLSWAIDKLSGASTQRKQGTAIPDKIILRREDIDFLVHELDLSRHEAETSLKEHKGDIVAAFRSLMS